nr:immunoglobulin heavy chain junction region [Homo sapiens]
CARLSPASW